MALTLHRPQTIRAKAATVLGLYVAAAFLAGLVPVAGLPGIVPVTAVACVLVGAFVVGQQLVWAGFWSLFGGLVAGAVFVISTFYGVHASVLAWRGEKVSATVAGVNTARHKGSTTYLYELVDASGHRIPGRLSEDWESFAVGEGVTVVVDPDGLVDPETPSEVEATGSIWITNGISVVVTGFMALWIARSRPREAAPRRGPGGLWIYDRRGSSS